VNSSWLVLEQVVDRQSERSTIADLLEIGNALSGDLALDRLLELILSKSRAITCSDAGSIYLIDRCTNPPTLVFKIAQNDSLPDLDLSTVTVPIYSNSLAGYVAQTGNSLSIADAYNLPVNAPYQFDCQFDLEFNYRTISSIVLPMQNRDGETIGILQLLNRKLDAELRVTPENATIVTQSYPKWQLEVVRSIASQAAISIERDRLLENIEAAFAGFVTAAVKAIERRDPATAGHSERVAALSVRLCEEVNHIDIGNLRSIHFDDRQLQEMQYAALLHDFGKIGVPEAILQKEKKLYPAQLTEIEQRFALIQHTWELECAETKFAYLSATPHQHSADTACFHCGYISQLDRELKIKLDRLRSYWDLIHELNEPDLLRLPKFTERLELITADLTELARYTYRDFHGNIRPLLTAAEIEQLLIPKGSLTTLERQIVEYHVCHTYEFLNQIPWSDRLQQVPLIAGSHHEKLDGSGYPQGLTAREIPIQAQIMAIADIYDALAASDRPYKPRLSIDRTLSILHQEAATGKINADLLALFEHRQVWSVVSF
jgi:HD-GYP domain-containing protein (c-di-GMP phosphodiesterase class II)